MERKKVVVFGGGTGLSTLLRGLKTQPLALTAVVTVADDGGSSGRILKDFNIPPPGDVRQVMGALTDEGHLFDDMFQYRFANGDELKGHSLGNLMLTALTDLTGDFSSAVQQLSSFFHLKGKVLPVANERMTLHAELEDGTIVTGESKIPMYGSKIQKVYLSPQEVEALPEVLQAIAEADTILIGPGSLYTSIIPTLLVKEVKEAIVRSQADKVYVANLTSQVGETANYTTSEHIQALIDHVGTQFLTAVIVHDHEQLTEEERLLTESEQVRLVEIDFDAIEQYNLHVYRANIASFINGRMAHDPDKIAKLVEQYYNSSNE